MKKNAILSAAIAGVGSLIIIGAVLLCVILSDSGRGDSLRITLNDGETRSVSFEERVFYPSKSSSMELTVYASREDEYELCLEFLAKSEPSLARYLSLRLECDGELIYEGALDELIGKERLFLERRLSRTRGAEIRVTYTMSADADNFAQNCEADVELLIRASNSEDLYE